MKTKRIIISLSALTLLIPAFQVVSCSKNDSDWEDFLKLPIIEENSYEGNLSSKGQEIFKRLDGNLTQGLYYTSPSGIGSGKYSKFLKELGKESIRLTSITLPTVTHIGTSPFTSSPLTSIEISQLQYVEDDAFANSVLTTANFDLLETIGKNAFGNSKLTSLSLPSAKIIRENAFYSSPLTSLSLPVASEIHDRAFYSAQLTSLSLPNAKYSGDSAFEQSPLTYISALNLYDYTTLVGVNGIGDNCFKSVVNVSSTTVKLKVMYTLSSKEKDRIFGANNYNHIHFKSVD